MFLQSARMAYPTQPAMSTIKCTCPATVSSLRTSCCVEVYSAQLTIGSRKSCVMSGSSTAGYLWIHPAGESGRIRVKAHRLQPNTCLFCSCWREDCVTTLCTPMHLIRKHHLP